MVAEQELDYMLMRYEAYSSRPWTDEILANLHGGVGRLRGGTPNGHLLQSLQHEEYGLTVEEYVLQAVTGLPPMVGDAVQDRIVQPLRETVTTVALGVLAVVIVGVGLYGIVK